MNLFHLILSRRRFLQVTGATDAVVAGGVGLNKLAGMEITKAPASVQHSSGESL